MLSSPVDGGDVARSALGNDERVLNRFLLEADHLGKAHPGQHLHVENLFHGCLKLQGIGPLVQQLAEQPGPAERPKAVGGAATATDAQSFGRINHAAPHAPIASASTIAKSAITGTACGC